MTMVHNLHSLLASCGVLNVEKEVMAKEKDWKNKELASKKETKNVMKVWDEQERKQSICMDLRRTYWMNLIVFAFWV